MTGWVTALLEKRHNMYQNHVCLVRRPIFRDNMQVLGYEIDADPAEYGNRKALSTSDLLVNSSVDFKLDDLVEGKLAFIPISSEHILNNVPLPEGFKNIVLQICDGKLSDEVVIAYLDAHNRETCFPIMLTGVNAMEAQTHRKLYGYADYVKLDLANYAPNQLATVATIFHRSNKQVVVDNISVAPIFEICKQHRFFGYMGRFFCNPTRHQRTKLPTSQITLLRVISEIENPRTTVNRLSDIVSSDVTFSYRILRFMNSAYFYLSKPVNSMKRAVTLAGTKNIKTWAIILAHSKFSDKPHELTKVALVRGKMCELLAMSMAINSESTFTLGMFSTLEALLDRPMEQILELLPLSVEIKDALLNYQNPTSNPLSYILNRVIRYEQSDWSTFQDSRLDAMTVRNNYYQALQWSNSMAKGLIRA